MPVCYISTPSDSLTIFVTVDGTQNCFTFTVNNQYTFYFTIPICGVAPSTSCSLPTFPEGTIKQMDLQAGKSYNLGFYSSYSPGYYQGKPAVNVTYTNGDSTGCTAPRSTVVYILCTPSVGIRYTELESPACAYTITIETSDSNICKVLNSAAPTLSPSPLPTTFPTAAPTVNCRRLGFDLTSFLSTSGVLNCFVASGNQYYYSFLIPACASAPSVCSSFGTANIGQLGTQFGHGNFNLGSYSDNWNLTTYGGSLALSVSYVNGDICSGIGRRNSTVYVVCDRSLQYNSIVQTEPSNCTYQFIVRTPDETLCAALSPVLSSSPTQAPSPSSVPTGALNGGYSPTDPTCPCNR